MKQSVVVTEHIRERYGELKNGVFIAGFTFARACSTLEWMLEDGRWKKLGFTNVNTFLDSIKLDQLRPTIEARKRIAQRIRELQPKVSLRQIGRTLGASKDTISRAVSNETAASDKSKGINSAPTQPVSNETPALSGSAAAKMVDKREAKPDETQRRQERDDKLRGMARAIPEGKFNVMYADPAWQHDEPFDSSFSRGVESHYPTMTIEEISALAPTIDAMCADNCTLYLWATAPKLAESMKILDAWGFAYRTHFVWVKDKIGLGWHNRNQHELLLVAKRGALPIPDNSDRISSVIVAPRGQHSAKPEIVREKLGEWYPHVPKIELFLRGKPATGWSGWGLEADE